MITILNQIEMIINNRPLTLLYYDNQDTLPNITDNKESNFTERVQYTKKLLNYFWSRWSYLIELREYRTKRYKNSRNKTITVNDTIIIMTIIDPGPLGDLE